MSTAKTETLRRCGCFASKAADLVQSAAEGSVCAKVLDASSRKRASSATLDASHDGEACSRAEALSRVEARSLTGDRRSGVRLIQTLLHVPHPVLISHSNRSLFAVTLTSRAFHLLTGGPKHTCRRPIKRESTKSMQSHRVERQRPERD